MRLYCSAFSTQCFLMGMGHVGTRRQGDIMRMFDPGGFSCRYKLYFLLTGYLNLPGAG